MYVYIDGYIDRKKKIDKKIERHKDRKIDKYWYVGLAWKSMFDGSDHVQDIDCVRRHYTY